MHGVQKMISYWIGIHYADLLYDDGLSTSECLEELKDGMREVLKVDKMHSMMVELSGIELMHLGTSDGMISFFGIRSLPFD